MKISIGGHEYFVSPRTMEVHHVLSVSNSHCLICNNDFYHDNTVRVINRINGANSPLFVHDTCVKGQTPANNKEE
jgi:hypothetical protein